MDGSKVKCHRDTLHLFMFFYEMVIWEADDDVVVFFWWAWWAMLVLWSVAGVPESNFWRQNRTHLPWEGSYPSTVSLIVASCAEKISISVYQQISVLYHIISYHIIPHHIIFHIMSCHVISHHIISCIAKTPVHGNQIAINLLDLELSLKPILYYKSYIYIYTYICALCFCAAELLKTHATPFQQRPQTLSVAKRPDQKGMIFLFFWRFVAWDEISVTYGFCLSNIWFLFFFGMRLHFFVAWCHAQRLGFPDQKTGALD